MERTRAGSAGEKAHLLLRWHGLLCICRRHLRFVGRLPTPRAPHEQRAGPRPQRAARDERGDDGVGALLNVHAERGKRHDDELNGRELALRRGRPCREGGQHGQQPFAAARRGVDDQVGAGGHARQRTRLHVAQRPHRQPAPLLRHGRHRLAVGRALTCGAREIENAAVTRLSSVTVFCGRFVTTAKKRGRVEWRSRSGCTRRERAEKGHCQQPGCSRLTCCERGSSFSSCSHH